MRFNSCKKIASVVLAVLLLFVATAPTSAIDLPVDPITPDVTDPDVISGVCGVNMCLTWTFNTKTGILTVYGNGSMKNYTSAQSVPWKSYLSDIKTVVILPGVAAVGNYAFYGCSSAEAVIFCGTSDQWTSVTKGTNYLPTTVSNVKLHSFTEGVCIGCSLVCEHETLNGDYCSTCGLKVVTVMLGDVNGDESITNADVLAIYRYIYNQSLYPLDVMVADVNKDGNITNADVLAIYRYIYNPTLYPLG